MTKLIELGLLLLVLLSCLGCPSDGEGGVSATELGVADTSDSRGVDIDDTATADMETGVTDINDVAEDSAANDADGGCIPPIQFVEEPLPNDTAGRIATACAGTQGMATGDIATYELIGADWAAIRAYDERLSPNDFNGTSHIGSTAVGCS